MFSIAVIFDFKHYPLPPFPSPLGDYVFNHVFDSEGVENVCLEFPSPLGDYVFNQLHILSASAAARSFRPLSGIMFSIF